MPSTSDNATGANKRRRANGSRAKQRDAAPTTTTAAATTSIAPNDPHQLLGTRLAPIMKVLASQPTSLQTYIIAKTNAMLDLLATIRQRGESHSRFMKPMTDAITGNTINEDDGAAKEFVPNSCRNKCPIRSSAQSNDDTQMKTLLEAADKDHEAWKLRMSTHAKTVSELEISIRNKQLRKLFYEFCRDLSLTQIVSFEIVNDGFPPGMVLSTPETAHMTAHTVLNTLALNKATFFGFRCDEEGIGTKTASNKLADDYAAIMSLNVASIKAKAKVDSDGIAVVYAVEKLQPLIPSLTVDLWKSIQDQERQQKINAAIKLALAPPAKKTATEEVEDALANLDPSNPTKSLLDLIDKRTTAGLEKIKAEMKRDLRKNYLAGSKTQELTPTRNGQRSKRASTAAGSQKKKNIPRRNPAATTTKPTPKTNPNPNPTGNGTVAPPRRKRGQRGKGSRAASNAGGQKKGAGRR